jgi:hypothetical protein
MIDPTVSRWVRGFDPTRGELVVEFRLPDSWTTERLRAVLGASKDDAMYDSYLLGAVHAKLLGDSVGQDLASYGLEFFLETDADT